MRWRPGTKNTGIRLMSELNLENDTSRNRNGISDELLPSSRSDDITPRSKLYGLLLVLHLFVFGGDWLSTGAGIEVETATPDALGHERPRLTQRFFFWAGGVIVAKFSVGMGCARVTAGDSRVGEVGREARGLESGPERSGVV
ncbi:hypothetical protein K435DRAFT_803439 [Dendrothele bispora CBS 962.96]|uniref:Uncharacterized protein n=1 Tax=Dendrothele bispora (strain CBS 962.96) TaxID=1314807 RepID=A0A4S8LHF0_DENBC|nr:hypothetical protein K435DRAFT_803439 [Dendrothele bispora CBS 962.96]